MTSAEAKQRIEKYGRNELVEKEASDLEKFLRFFWGPIAWMIEAAAVLSLLMGHWADLTIILVLLFYNAISGFWQERKASDALAARAWHLQYVPADQSADMLRLFALQFLQPLLWFR